MKFQVTTTTWPKASGGTDAIIGVLTVVPALAPQGAAQAAAEELPRLEFERPSYTQARFAVTTPLSSGAIARLGIFDLAGRRLASIRGPSGSRLVWHATDASGQKVGPGIYYYCLDLGAIRHSGKFVLVR